MPNTSSTTRRNRGNVTSFRPVTGQPHSIPAEQSLIGGLMLDNSTWQAVREMVSEGDFYRAKHRLIYKAICELDAKGSSFDIVTMTDELEQTGLLDEAGGQRYLAIIARDTPSAANVLDYAKIVQRHSLERQRLAAIARNDQEGHRQAAAITAAIDALAAGTGSAALLTEHVSVEALDEQPFTRTWLVEGLIEQGRVYEFFGKYKEGKTLSVIDIVSHLSVARTYANRRSTQALVVWVAGEAVDDVQMRIVAWRRRHGVTGPTPFYIRTKPVYMTDQQFAARLTKEIEALKQRHPGLPALLVLDSVARCMEPGAEENSITGLGAFINNLLDIVVRPLNATAICVHHSGHGDRDRGRGHSSFEAGVDGIVKVSMDKKSGQSVITVATGPVRSTAGGDSFSFRIDVERLPGQDNFGNPIDAPVLQYLEGYQPESEPTAARMGANQTKALALLREQYQQHRANLESAGRDPEVARVTQADWHKAMKEAGFIKQRCYELKANLLKRGQIRVEGDFVFLVEPVTDPGNGP